MYLLINRTLLRKMEKMKMKTIKLSIITAICALQFTQAYGVAGQACNVNLVESAPASNFTINAADATVIDNNTNLMWKRCVQGQTWNSILNKCEGSKLADSWKGALEAADTETFAGFSDWRLPNLKELYSIIETSCTNPALNATVFTDQNQVNTWTSTVDIKSGNEDRAFVLNFYYGISQSINTKDQTHHYRLVRDI